MLRAIHEEDAMPGYVIANVVEVSGPAGFQESAQRVGGTITQYGGRYVAAACAVDAKEGDWKPNRLVLVEFPSLARAREWYDSPEYRPLIPRRQRAARAELVFSAGV
jgi:uncharacterized protein (DUF1330 family)